MKTKILIADDDQLSLTILTNFLEGWGYEVLKAKNGMDCFFTLKQNPDVQLVIADWLMPEMNGIELIKKIRMADLNRYVYVILLTMKEKSNDIIEGFEAGADDYIIKPIVSMEVKLRLKVGERIISYENQLKKS